MMTPKRLVLWGTVMLVAIAPGCFNRSTDVTSAPPTPSESVPAKPASPELPPPAAEAPEPAPAVEEAPAPAEPEPAPPDESTALNCDDALTQAEINLCAQQSYEAADRELNRVYQELRNNLSPEEREELRQAELEWIKTRDANCEAESSEYEGGSLQPTIRFGCLEEMTKNRTAELQAQLEASS